jgi:hypothetical protein
MTVQVGARNNLALLPGGGVRRRGVQTSRVVQVFLLMALVVAVLVALVCDSRRYHGVDMRGQPIYPEDVCIPSDGVDWQLPEVGQGLAPRASADSGWSVGRPSR